MDPYKIIYYPIVSESVLEMIENENKLAFIVNRRANKHTIKRAVEDLYEVKVEKVNTMILPDGRKKALVKLTSDYVAGDLATKLGLF